MLADRPLQIIECRVVFRQGHVGDCAAPICRGIGACVDHDGEGLLRLAGRQSGEAQGRVVVRRRLVGIEGRTVVAGIPPLHLVEKMRRESMRLFDSAHRSLGRVGLTIVEGDGSNVAARRGLPDWIGTGLAANGCNQRECVLGIDDVVETVRHRPIDESRCVGGDIVVLQSCADPRRR